MSTRMRSVPLDGCGGCLGVLAYLALALSLGAWTFDYCLYQIAGRDVPWWADVLAGLFVGTITTPLAIILWVLRLAGIHGPWVH